MKDCRPWWMPCQQSDTRSVLWAVPPIVTQQKKHLETHKTPRKAFFLKFYQSGGLIDTLEMGREADFSGGIGYFKLCKPLEEMLLLRLFPLTRTCLKWGFIFVELRLFYFCLIFEEIICFFYKHWTFCWGEWDRSWQTPARRGSAEPLPEAVPPSPVHSLLQAHVKNHIWPLQFLLTSSWSRCATTSHRKEFLKSKWNKFL